METLVTPRVHSAIPALGLGAKVLNLAIDSRAEALTTYGIASHPLAILREPVLPLHLAQAGPPEAVMAASRQRVVELWKEHMHP